MSTYGPFAGIDISRSGLGFNKYWLDTVSHNIANLNTMTTPGQDPFRARMVIAVPISPASSYGGGVQVASVVDQEGDPPMVYAPEDPRSDEQGYMQGPVVDLAGQMGDMILASRSYQANMSVFKEARDALENTTTLGRR